MKSEKKDEIYRKAVTIIGNPPRGSGRCIPYFVSEDEALTTGLIGIWIKPERHSHNEENEESLWQLAKQALDL